VPIAALGASDPGLSPPRPLPPGLSTMGHPLSHFAKSHYDSAGEPDKGGKGHLCHTYSGSWDELRHFPPPPATHLSSSVRQYFKK